MNLFEEHFNEATFLWHQRERVLVSPELTPNDAAALEWRLHWHVDGLVLAGASLAEKRLASSLEADEPEQIAVAALVLLDEEIQRQEPVFATLRQGSPTQRLAICQALQTRPRSSLKAPLLEMLDSSPPALQALLLDVLSPWSALPASFLEQCLTTGVPQLQEAALRALRGPLPRPTRALLIDCLSSKTPGVRQAAIAAGLMLGVDVAWRACLQQAASQDSSSATARLIVAFGGEAREQSQLLAALRAPGPDEFRRQTLWALGFSGTVNAVEACLELLSSPQPRLARLAGEAFSSITGLRLKGSFVVNDPEVDMEDEGEDASPTPSPEARLPLPAADAVVAWWHQHRDQFSAHVRYLEGRPCSPERLLAQVGEGSMRRRSTVVLELTLRSQGAWALPQRAFIEVQRQRLEQAYAPPTLFRMEPIARLVHRVARPSTEPAQPRPASRQAHPSMSPDAIVITAMGMVSPLAMDVVASCAAARAGLMHASELEGMDVLDPTNGESYPVLGHAVSQLTYGFTGLGRLARLGEAALRELRSSGGVSLKKRTGLYVALPSQAHALAYARWLAAEESEEEEEWEPIKESKIEGVADPLRQPEHALLPLLIQFTGIEIPRAQQRTFPQDALGFLQALTEASRDLRQGRLDCCIIGGLDSLVEPSRLQTLKALGLLKVPGQPARMLPGEAAAFLVLERHRDAMRRGAQVLATCEGLHVPVLSPSTWEGASKVGRALAQSLVTTLSSQEDRGRSTGRIIGSLNGHDRRAYAWGHALSILGSYGGLSQLPVWSPAESFGELGAATGPVSVCMAIRDFARGAAASPHAIAWLMGDEGATGSFYLRTALRERMPLGDIP